MNIDRSCFLGLPIMRKQFFSEIRLTNFFSDDVCELSFEIEST